LSNAGRCALSPIVSFRSQQVRSKRTGGIKTEVELRENSVPPLILGRNYLSLKIPALVLMII
jgi:hypothetical protein